MKGGNRNKEGKGGRGRSRSSHSYRDYQIFRAKNTSVSCLLIIINRFVLLNQTVSYLVPLLPVRRANIKWGNSLSNLQIEKICQCMGMCQCGS